jgi:hypothetical protein
VRPPQDRWREARPGVGRPQAMQAREGMGHLESQDTRPTGCKDMGADGREEVGGGLPLNYSIHFVNVITIV